MEGVAEALDLIEKNLVEAAEACMTANLSHTLYESMVKGIVLMLPKPRAPHHIKVLMSLKSWVNAQLLTPSLQGMLQQEVITASRVQDPIAGSSSCDSQ